MRQAVPGQVVVTDGYVPLRFIVLGRCENTVWLYCTARCRVVKVNWREFYNVEKPMVSFWASTEIKEEIGPYAARVAVNAHESYLDGSLDGCEIID